MFLFFALHAKLAQYATRSQNRLVAEAFLLAADAHETQLRSSGEPYITHPVAVAEILADMHMDVETIMAALLHDVIEDTDVAREDLIKQFGSKVAQLVEGVSKLTQIRFESKAHAQAENFRKMMLAMVEDVRVILIKLADRLHNMRTLGALRSDKKRRIAQETLDIYVPLAHRLGMNAFKAEFEVLCFQAIYPLRARILEQCVNAANGNRRKLLDKIHAILADHLAKEDVPPDHILGREKRLYSIYQKMLHRRVPFAEIMDVYAFRIIAKDQRDCYRLLGAVHSVFKPVPGRFKDYIAIPKANGYQSLHTTLFGPHGVPVEIQIRTQEMDQIAEQGIAAHWLYKSSGYVSATEVKTREWLSQLLDMQKRTGNSLDFIEDVKIDLFPDEVYVFTPKGDIMALPRGITVLDFAYAVHTDLGNHCAGAKVNRRPAPLNQELLNGQTVEVLRDPTVFPDPGWLNVVVTGKAKAAIRHYLKSDKQEAAVTLGKQVLQHALSEFSLSWDMLSAQDQNTVLSTLLQSSEKKLFEQIGLGECPVLLVVHEIIQLSNRSGQKTAPQTSLVIASAEGANMTFAHCCYPLPGEPVRAILQKGHGIEVHNEDCVKLKAQLKDLPPEKVMSLTWAEQVMGQFAVKLKIDTANRPGILAAITQVIASDSANIEEVVANAYARHSGGMTTVIMVTGREHLTRIMRHLRQIPEVIQVSRVKEE